jgi:hypothetical protein
MKWSKVLKCGRTVLVLMAAGIGSLIGGWHVTALRSTELSAADTVALRFPDDWNNLVPVPRAALAATLASDTTSHVEIALLSPEPTVPRANPETNLQPAPESISEAVSQSAVQSAATEQIGSSPAPDTRQQLQTRPAAVRTAIETKTVVAAHRHIENRPGYMLNDTQIASIKERLHMTLDQERMWPAVEAALRNVSYARTQEMRGRGVPAGAAAQPAAVDPNSVEVQGLKSAAVPLIMSFNSEQKEQVRTLAHVMGLDQLASQF